MKLLYCIFASLIFLFYGFAINSPGVRPSSTKIRYKYRVKDNSIFRKIIKFKDEKFHPRNYF